MTASDLTAPPSTREVASAGKQLELAGVSKRYGPVVALDDVSFTVQPGELCGFVGANGAGKTTAMRIVMGIAAADRGELRWGGEPVDEAGRRTFGYMPEERGLYPKMRVTQQLAYLARLHGLTKPVADAAARWWLDALGLAERANDRLEALSLGNQQRVQLAAALVHDPALLILDEPFSGLDPSGIDALSDVLRQRAEAGTAVLFSSHQLELVERLCERVVIVDDGQLVASDPVAQLRAGEGRVLRVHVTDARDGWAAGLPGVTHVGDDGDGAGGTLLALEEDVDSQGVLDAARRAGRVEHFGFQRRSLAEIFREVVEK